MKRSRRPDFRPAVHRTRWSVPFETGTRFRGTPFKRAPRQGVLLLPLHTRHEGGRVTAHERRVPTWTDDALIEAGTPPLRQHLLASGAVHPSNLQAHSCFCVRGVA
eukprot:scaffold650_cov407-Prasinococcus_capsulatus_cf.AAC.13